MRLSKGMLNLLSAITLITFSYSSVLAANYELKPGLWTGFDNSNMSYIMLYISKNNKHTFNELHFPSGFKSGKRFPFTNDDVSCNSLQCVITLNRKNGYLANVTISQRYGDEDRTISVFDTRFHSTKDFRATFNYELHKENHKSAARRFINLYRDSIEQLYSTTNDGLKGLWIGVWNIDDKMKELVVLEIEHGNNGKLLRLLNDTSVNLLTLINSSDVVIDGKSVDINALSNGNRVIADLSFRSENNLTGLLQAKLNDLIISEGRVSLMRVKEPRKR